MSTSSLNDNSGSNLWDEFVRSAQVYYDTGRLASEEIDYKLEIGRKLAATREAVLSKQPGDEGWSDQLKAAFQDKENNLIDFRPKPPFISWINEHPNEVLLTLRILWDTDAPSLRDRITAFSSRFPTLFYSQEPPRKMGRWVRMKIISVLLMGLDVEQYPPFMSSFFDEAFKRTGYPNPGSDADEAALYDHAPRLPRTVRRGSLGAWSIRAQPPRGTVVGLGSRERWSNHGRRKRTLLPWPPCI